MRHYRRVDVQSNLLFVYTCRLVCFVGVGVNVERDGEKLIKAPAKVSFVKLLSSTDAFG
jgi:hypothetical protein